MSGNDALGDASEAALRDCVDILDAACLAAGVTGVAADQLRFVIANSLLGTVAQRGGLSVEDATAISARLLPGHMQASEEDEMVDIGKRSNPS